MNNYQLRSFVTAADLGSFTRAAKELHVAVPSFSQQIKALEKELGFSLFTRSKQGVELTPSGAVMYEVTKRSIALFAEARRRALCLVEEQSQTLVIACDSAGQPPKFQTDIIALARQHMPLVTVKFAPVSYDELFRSIREKKIDVCFFTPPDEEQNGDLCYRPLYDDRILCCVTPSDPLASKESIQPSDLIGYTIYIEGFAIHESQMAPFFDEIDLKLISESFSVAQLMNTQSRKSVIFIPESYVASCCPPLVGIPISWRKIQHGITYRANPTPTVKRFLKIVSGYFAEAAGACVSKEQPWRESPAAR